jgi:hypothetical protein
MPEALPPEVAAKIAPVMESIMGQLVGVGKQGACSCVKGGHTLFLYCRVLQTDYAYWGHDRLWEQVRLCLWQ